MYFCALIFLWIIYNIFDMEKERSIDRLARYIILIGAIALVAATCYYFSSVLAYIILAFVVSLIWTFRTSSGSVLRS